MNAVFTIEYMPKHSPRRGKTALRRTAAKKTKIALFREFGVPDGAYRRYKGLKGIYWYWFSKRIKERDYEKFGGLCITCLKYVPKEQAQCGHIFPARDCGFTLLFHELNCHLQHSKCNNPRFTPGAGVLNAMNVNNRYGHDTIDQLFQLKSQREKEWSKELYIMRIKELQEHKL